MTVANQKEYNEQVRPRDEAVEGKHCATTSSRVVAQGFGFLDSNETHSSNLQPMQKENTIFSQALRLHSIADRLVRASTSANDLLHRGGGKVLEGQGCGIVSISSVLEQTENLLEKAESELIILTGRLGEL